ncbi:hypothetical protein PZE06_21380 [Robertmurraya sp. DFI.2.37]|uniref:hypothetical protein n=1 Tax=Robertmurraya sp. DFI.2.37 TaxID=3031819 RepID=UPI001786C31B|nr:hypothetical protein [Robertmurraya sp. DFI.2.37]MDF1510691.1 hypothetical protein [Robertmurraya sp. DFI.2.37]
MKKKIIGSVIIAALLLGGLGALSGGKEVADPGKGGLKSIPVEKTAYDPGPGGL